MTALASLAARLHDDPWFLASALETYRRSEELDTLGLADRLGCPAAMLVPLGLCRKPEGERFREDVDRIAGRFALDPAVLAQVIRRSDALQALRSRDAQGAGGTLMAARDRKEEET